MPIYKLRADRMEPFHTKTVESGLYEEEVEQLVWEFPEELIGEPLLLVARRRSVSKSLIPDIVALDGERRVVVVEVKRTLDRGQLAQGLEYAGWAMNASLETLASLYSKQHIGKDFFQAWSEWSSTSTIEVLSSLRPRLILIAGSFHDDTWRAIEFANASQEVIETREVTIHVGDAGETIVELQGVTPAVTGGFLPVGSAAGQSALGRRIHYGVTLADLVEAGLLHAGDELRWDRRRAGIVHTATVLPGGVGLLMEGKEYSKPSGAADAASGTSNDGWTKWTVLRGESWVSLHDLRERFLQAPR